jgi:hypothetical protein
MEITRQSEEVSDAKIIKEGCPVCAERVYFHSLSIWCMRCGWGKNRAGVPK